MIVFEKFYSYAYKELLAVRKLIYCESKFLFQKSDYTYRKNLFGKE